ncbi:hypothetical protein ACFL44_02425 [Gemmatimonadota bacterium]
MESLIVIVLAGAVLIALIVRLILKYRYKRRDAFQEQAQMLGFSFTSQAEMDQIGEAGTLHLFSMGHGKKIRNLMTRIDSGMHTHVYDYRYTTGGGQHSQTHNQTVFQFQIPRMHLPAFTIRPENVFHKIGQSFGYMDIDFEDHPEFSKRYLLRGEDEAAVRSLFSQEVITRFESENGIIVEGKGSLMICYRSSRRVRPDDLWTGYESMQTLVQMFARQSRYL